MCVLFSLRYCTVCYSEVATRLGRNVMVPFALSGYSDVPMGLLTPLSGVFPTRAGWPSGLRRWF